MAGEVASLLLSRMTVPHRHAAAPVSVATPAEA
jgi:hypothetical protein